MTYGVVSISTTTMEMDDEGRMRSSATMDDGAEILTEDVWFAADEDKGSEDGPFTNGLDQSVF